MSNKKTEAIGIKHRNGIIEIIRFLFILTIMIGHAKGIFGVDLPIAYGTTYVEFFFMITGFYLAKGLEENARQMVGDGGLKETAIYLLRKFKRYIPYTFPSVLLAQLWLAPDFDWNGYGWGGVLANIYYGIAETLMIKPIMMEAPLRVAPLWTLNAMLFASFIIIIVINNKTRVCKEFIPAIVGIGTYINIEWIFGSAKYPIQLLRAIGGMCLGVTIFNLLKNSNHKINEKINAWVNGGIIVMTLFAIWLSTTEYYVRRLVLTILFIIVYLIMRMPVNYGNKVTDFIGKLSMGVYILHYPIGLWINRELMNLSLRTQIILYLVGSIVCSVCIFSIVSLSKSIGLAKNK